MSNCKRLKSITFPNQLIVISEGILYNCIELEKLIIPNSVIGINGWAFSYCNKLEEIIIPDSVEWLGENVFYHDISLKRLTIKNPDINISTVDLFTDCYNLKIENLDQLTQDILKRNGFRVTIF